MGDGMLEESPLTEREKLIFESYMKEYDALREEEMIAIQHVRRLPVTATYIAGFAFPVIAGILTGNFSGDRVNSATMDTLMNSLKEGGEICAVLCIATAFVCLALLHIYLGSFKQIFNFAKYIRSHIQPQICSLLSTEAEIFHWEIWLNNRRQTSSSKVGDGDLSAEPIVISCYIVFFCALSCVFSYSAKFVLPAFLCFALICIVSNVFVFVSFYRTLKNAL